MAAAEMRVRTGRHPDARRAFLAYAPISQWKRGRGPAGVRRCQHL